MSENFYNILGINENSTKDEIKKAYRTLQMKYHPDKNQNSLESIDMTQKINEAYEILSDDNKKKDYDMMRNNSNLFMRTNSQGGGGGGMEVPIDDILNIFFGGGAGSPFGMHSGAKFHIFNGGPMGFNQAIQKPVPIIKTITINIEYVLSGGSVPLEIERWIMENGIKFHEKETIYVTIPEGVDDNEIIILRDKGNIINENVKGDIKIFVKIENNTLFKRSGLDLILDKNITLKESLCGFTFEIKFINGKSYTLINNKGNIISPEYKKVYSNMGLTRGHHKGNMIINFHIEFPEKLSEEQILKLDTIL